MAVRAQVPAWSLEAQARLLGGAGAANRLAERAALVQQAEHLLAAGDTAGAQQALDRAAMVVHSADVEITLVRADMQAGNYRRALTFASHAAGAHRNVPGGTALYAWLLHLGGQPVFARRLLDEALALAPDDAALQAASTQLATPWPQPPAALLDTPLRAAPYATGAVPSAAARVVASATLLGDGRLACVPATAVPAQGRLWLRNGMGQTVAARCLPADSGAADGLAWLQLDAGLPMPPVTVAPAPFAGSPGTTVEFTPGGSDAAWPLLRQGFFGRALAAPGDRLLGFAAPSGPRGGPVFDRLGRLAGVAVPGADGRDRLVLAERLPAGAIAALAAATPPPADAGATDAVYELALRLSLQLLAAG